MAPNLNQRPLLLQTAAGLNLQPIKAAAFPPLTLEVAQSQDYWEWSGDNDAEIQRLTAEEEAARIVSADHIVENIQTQAAAAVKRPSTTAVAANDQYWDWSHDQTESVDYWNWPVANNGTIAQAAPASVEETDAYWGW